MKQIYKLGRTGLILGVIAIVGLLLVIVLTNMKSLAQNGVQWSVQLHRYMGYEFSPHHVRQLVTEDMAHSRVIMWDTQDFVVNSSLELRKVGDEAASIRRYAAISECSTHDNKTQHLYKVVLHDLEPNTSYQYRVGEGLYVSEWYPLQTGPGQDVQFLVFPDSRSHNYTTWHNVAQGGV